MGLFKSREEKEAERRQREQEAEELAQKIGSSPMTQQLQAFLLKRFGDLNGEEVTKLRRLAGGGGRAGYLLHVEREGIWFDLINRSGETFDAMGYENLPYSGVNILKTILLQTLNTIPHLLVSETGFFMYDQNRAKQSW